MTSPFPSAGTPLTHILVVSDAGRSKLWYRDVLGAEVDREYGTSVVLSFNGNWLLLVEPGEPTADKPDIQFALPRGTQMSHSFTMRVDDCQGAYETLLARGAEFLTPPYDWGPEVRCFFRDPDGHLFEISEYRG